MSTRSHRYARGVAQSSQRERERVRWNDDMVEHRKMLGLPTVNLDWDTARYFYDQGMSPKEAAERVRVR